MKTLKHRRTPWDEQNESFPYPQPIAPPKAQDAASSERPGGRTRLFCLRGLYVYDPERSTSGDFRQFLWSGLRVLHAEAQARGLSDEQVRQLVLSAFDAFHDSADGLWTALRNIVKDRQEALRQTAQVPAPGPAPGHEAGNGGGPATLVCKAKGDPALEALREAQSRRSAQSRRRHARMDRELEDLSDSEK